MRKWWLLIGLVILAAVLRLVWLDKRPIGFTWDEAALGYNAYSLLKTGRDEYGTILPVVLTSFGDYKPGAYAYFTVPTIALLGLTETATRLPSALMGTLLVTAVFVLARRLTLSVPAALATALGLALTPWAIQFSRGAWEANLALLLVVVGTITALNRRLGLTALLWGLSLWSYQGAKLFTPLIAVVCWWLIHSQLSIKRLIWPGLIFGACLLPLIVNFSDQSGRLKVYSVFSYRRQPIDVAEIVRQDGGTKDWQYYLWHSEGYDQLRGVVQRYTNYFSPDFLFFSANPSNLRESTTYAGYLLVPHLLALVIGGYHVLKSKVRWMSLAWAWICFAPFPAALSRDLLSGVRSLPMVVPLMILVGVGWASLWKVRWVGLLYSIIVAGFSLYYLNLYFIHAPYYAAEDMVSAYTRAWQTVKAEQTNYDQIVFTTKLGQPYIFGLFYLQYDPRSYQAQASLIANASGDVGQVKGFDKFTFRELYWPEDRKLKKTLFVGGQYELPVADLNQDSTLARLGDIIYADNTTALRMVGTP